MHLLSTIVVLFVFLANSALSAATIGDKLEDGLWVSLPGQEGNINVRMANYRFQLYFLNAEDKIIALNVAAASIRYAPFTAPQDYTYAAFDLSQSGDSFISSFYVPPPNLYWISITFFKKENGKLINLKTFDPVQLSQVEPEAPTATSFDNNVQDDPTSVFGSNAKPAKNSSNKTLGPDYQDVE